MPHRQEAVNNLLALLGPRAHTADADVLIAALEGMGIVFDKPMPDEPIIGALAAATAADLRDSYVVLAPRDHPVLRDRYGLFEIDAALRAIGFCIARVR